MVKIDQQPESRLSPIKFFVSKAYAERAIDQLGEGAFASAHGLKVGVWTNWYVKVARRGYLRESGEIY